MGIFKKRDASRVSAPATQPKNTHPFGIIDGYIPLGAPQIRLYYTLREAIPVIDAAILKIVRLTGGFEVKCSDKSAQSALDDFVNNVPVGGNRQGLSAFIDSYLEQLLTCGTAVGEIVSDTEGNPRALFNAPLNNIELKRHKNGFDIDIFVRDNLI